MVFSERIAGILEDCTVMDVFLRTDGVVHVRRRNHVREHLDRLRLLDLLWVRKYQSLLVGHPTPIRLEVGKHVWRLAAGPETVALRRLTF